MQTVTPTQAAMARLERAAFPSAPDRPILLLTVALHANGDSSYRDARNLQRLASRRFGRHARTVIVTDSLVRDGFFREADASEPGCVRLVRTRADFLETLSAVVGAHSASHDVLFSLSAHGYSGAAASAASRREEADGQDEYVLVGGVRVFDHEMRDALYGPMDAGCTSLCLIDTCRSGTMLDLPFFSINAMDFTHVPVEHLALPAASFCISACSDAESNGEDVSDFGGWGGRLTSQFLDYVASNARPWRPIDFYRSVYAVLVGLHQQRAHPIFSCTTLESVEATNIF